MYRFYLFVHLKTSQGEITACGMSILTKLWGSFLVCQKMFIKLDKFQIALSPNAHEYNHLYHLVITHLYSVGLKI